MGQGRDYSVGKYLARELADAVKLEKDNLVVAINAAGKLTLAVAASTVYAIAAKSTQDPVARIVGTVSYLTGAKFPGGVPTYRSGLSDLPLEAANTAIEIGDRLVVGATTAGHVDKGAAEGAVADQLKTVGFSEEKKAADSGGTILTALSIKFGGGP